MRANFTGWAAKLDRNAPLLFWALFAGFLVGTSGDHYLREAADVLAPQAQPHTRALYERLLEWAHLFAYGSSALVSYFAAQWWLFLLDLVLAALWLLPRPDESRGVLHALYGGVEFLNRQLGHVGAAFLLVIAAANFLQQFPAVQLVMASGMVLAAPRGIDTLLARYLRRRRKADKEKLANVDADVFWARRPVFYVLTVVGIALLFAASPVLWRELVRSALCAVLAVTIRTLRWMRGFRGYQRRGVHDETAAFETDEARMTRRRWDRRVVLAAVALGLVPAATILGGDDAADKKVRNVHWTRCAEVLAEKVPSAPPDASLFIVADSQYHELRGERAGSHLDVIDALVPVAVRPVELDLLSGATLANFGEALQRTPGQRWTHLGDAGDLACSTELDRFGATLAAHYPKDGLAFLVPGNHDSTFVGNFHWHPDWQRTCRPRRGTEDGHYLSKSESDDKLVSIANAQGLASAAAKAHPFTSHTGPSRSALYGLTLLGTLGGGATRRALYGVFVDTSDYTLIDAGVAGASGNISRGQLAALRDALAAVEPDALAILFLHHPLDELSPGSRSRLGDFARRALPGRLLAIVSAHTHMAGLRDHRCAERRFAGPRVPELVVGSVIDPPQEASLLEVWGVDGSATLRMRTLPAVAREGLACSLTPPARSGVTPGGATCTSIFQQLASEHDCKELFLEAPPPRERNDYPPAPPAAPVVAQLAAQVAQPVAQVPARGDYSDADEAADAKLCSVWRKRVARGLAFTAEPDDVYCAQRDRAIRLRRCVCRGGSCSERGNPLDARLYDDLFAARADRRDELVCLSWAASVLQDKKADGWPFARALQLALDRGSAYGALETVINLRDAKGCGTDLTPQLSTVAPMVK